MSEDAAKSTEGLEQLAKAQARQLAQQDRVMPGECVDATVAGIPWSVVALIAAGAVAMAQGMTAWRGAAAGLAITCGGIFLLSYGLWALARNTIVMRYSEARNDFGSVISTEECWRGRG